jgi:CheY-like chemotaxis protein
MSVRDTGVGMSEGIQAHLFEPFFTTKAPGQGTGLGLSTVYGIVQQHRGAIDVVSLSQYGSAFHLSFPRSGDPLPVPAANPEPAAGTPGVGTVLVVEDEERVRALTVEVLRQAGYKVLEACDGEDALEVARAHAGVIDALLTDVILPGENGRVLFDRLSALRPGLRVLFMSGYAADVIGQHGVLDPGVSFIQKPFAIRALSARMAEVLKRA